MQENIKESYTSLYFSGLFFFFFPFFFLLVVTKAVHRIIEAEVKFTFPVYKFVK